jgi:hypothetical protein
VGGKDFAPLILADKWEFVLRLLTNRSGLVATVFIASFEYCGDDTVLFIAA